MNPLTTAGDLIVRQTSNETRLPIGTQDQYLTVDSNAISTGGIAWKSQYYGTMYQYAESLNVNSMSTSTTVWTTKITLTTPTLPSGTYRLAYFAQGITQTASRRVKIRVIRNSVTEVADQEFTLTANSTTGTETVCDFLVVNLTTGSHTFDVQYQSQNGANVGIRDIHVEFYRIA